MYKQNQEMFKCASARVTTFALLKQSNEKDHINHRRIIGFWKTNG